MQHHQNILKTFEFRLGRYLNRVHYPSGQL